MNTQTGLMPGNWAVRAWTLMLCLLTGALLGLPFGALALVALSAVLVVAALCVAKPLTALCGAVALLLLIPQYLLLELPGAPAIPLSLAPLALLVGVLGWRAALAAQPMPRVRGPLVAAYGWFGAALLLAALDAGNREALLLLIRAYLIPSLLFIAVLYHARRAGDGARVLNWLLAAAVIIALFAVFEFSVKRNDLLEKLLINTGSDLSVSISQFYIGSDAFAGQALIYRCFSVFTNPLEYGTFMTMIYPYALVHAVMLAPGRARRMYIGAALLCATGIVLSFSRGPLLALLLSTLALAVFLRPLRRVVTAGLLVMLVAAIAAWPFIGDQVRSRLNEVDNVTVRFKLWETGARMFLDHPLLGVGLSRYAEHENQTIIDYGIGPFYEYGGNIERIATVDNHLIQLAAETGSVGLVAYLALLALFARAVWRVWRRHPSDFARHTALALGAGVANYLLNGLTITSYLLFVITMMCTLFMALMAALDAEVRA